MLFKTPELVLLDLDGTLVDSIPDLAFAVNHALKVMNLEQRKIEDIRKWVGNGLEKLLHRALTFDMEGEANEKVFNTAMTHFMDCYSRYPCERSECYIGVKDGISILKKQGIKLGCVTNKRGAFVGPILEKLGIKDDMSIIIAGDTLSKKKPDPLPLLHAAESLKIDSEQTMMVGDSESDVKAARAAGVPVVCVSYGYNHGKDIRLTDPDAVIDSLSELPKLFN